MKINEALAEKILETSLQIKTKFGISIGYSHPMGCFINNDNDFIIFQKAIYNKDKEDFDYAGMYIFEYNQFEHEVNGIFSRLTTDPKQKTNKIIDFLIDFHQWMKTGLIKVEELREYGPYKWKPAGDGRFFVEKSEGSGCSTGYCSHLDEMDDTVIRDHIQSIYFGK